MTVLAVVIAVVLIAAAALLGGVGALPLVLIIAVGAAGVYFVSDRARRRRMTGAHPEPAGPTENRTGVRGFSIMVVAIAVIFLLLVVALIWRSAWWPDQAPADAGGYSMLAVPAAPAATITAVNRRPAGPGQGPWTDAHRAHHGCIVTCTCSAARS